MIATPRRFVTRTDAEDATVNPSVNSSLHSSSNSLQADIEQGHEGVKPSSLPISTARHDLTLELFSTHDATPSSPSRTSSLSTDRPIASQSFRTANPLIFPPDQRVPVTQPNYPFSAVGRMISRWEGADGRLNTRDDVVLSSSGAMVSKFHFLTAGHSVYEKKYGGWAARVEVQLPRGRTAFSTYLRTYEGWIRNQDFKYDLGLVTLDRKIGDQTGWFGYGYSNTIRAGRSFNSTGYPSDKVDANGDGIRDNFNVWTQVGKITQTTALTLRSTDLDLAPGASGGPLWLRMKSGPTIYGVTSNRTGNLYGEFTRITGDRFKDIGRWIQEDMARRPLYAAASSDHASRHHAFRNDGMVASTRTAVGQFEDDIFTGGQKALGQNRTDRSSIQAASQPARSMAQTMRSVIEADNLRHAIVPSHGGNSELPWNNNHSFALAVQVLC